MDTNDQEEQSSNNGKRKKKQKMNVINIMRELGSLPPGTPITEDGLAELTGRECRETIKRTVDKGELPPPVKFMGRNIWTAGVIREHLERRLEAALRRDAKART